jgi:hypothetical protein
VARDDDEHHHGRDDADDGRLLRDVVQVLGERKMPPDNTWNAMP